MADVPEGALRRLGERSYCVESTPEGSSNAGLVVGDRAALVVDARLTPSFGRALAELVEALAPGQPRFLVLTHHHGDHCFGAGELADAVVICSSWTRAALAERWDEQVSAFREIRPHQADEFERARRVVPHVSADGPIELDLGGVAAELRLVGPAHTPGDVVVRVPLDDVLFAGDTVFNGHWPIFWDADAPAWRELVAGAELRAGTVVPGHGAAGGAELVDRMGDCLDLLFRRAQGTGPADAGPFADWLHPQRIEEAVRHLNEGEHHEE